MLDYDDDGEEKLNELETSHFAFSLPSRAAVATLFLSYYFFLFALFLTQTEIQALYSKCNFHLFLERFEK